MKSMMMELIARMMKVILNRKFIFQALIIWIIKIKTNVNYN